MQVNACISVFPLLFRNTLIIRKEMQINLEMAHYVGILVMKIHANQ